MAVGIQVWLALALVLAWCRWIPDILVGMEGNTNQAVGIVHPAGLVPEEIVAEPNVRPDQFFLQSHTQACLALLGIGGLYDRVDRIPVSLSSPQHEGGRPVKYAEYYDKGRGLLVRKRYVRKDVTWDLEGRWLAGPNGIGTEPNEALGRFVDPIGESGFIGGVILDRGLQTFFRVRWRQGDVEKVPKTSEVERLVQIGSLCKNSFLLNGPAWTAPVRQVLVPRQDPNEGQRDICNLIAIQTGIELDDHGPGKLALGEFGAIYLLDTETLKLGPQVAHLPADSRPRDLLAYSVRQIRRDGQYIGCAVGALSGNGDDLGLAVYDANGGTIGNAGCLLLGLPPALTPRLAGRYLLENLQPLASSALSIAFAPHCEAGAGHRALIIRPHCLAATWANAPDFGYQAWIERPFATLFILLPSILLASGLAWAVAADATHLGLSGRTRRIWIAATLALGLVAYITYRLTTPGPTMVTCASCGRPRRPDRDRCHRCKASWEVPALVPPAWRVMD